jgi:hypothetical protein
VSVYKPANLPTELKLDATIPEVMAFRRESARTVYRKIESGACSHRNGDRRRACARIGSGASPKGTCLASRRRPASGNVDARASALKPKRQPQRSDGDGP